MLRHAYEATTLSRQYRAAPFWFAILDFWFAIGRVGIGFCAKRSSKTEHKTQKGLKKFLWTQIFAKKGLNNYLIHI